MEILRDLHVLRSPESKNHIFRIWSVTVCVCLLSLKNKLQQKHQIWYSAFVLHTDTTTTILLETFYGDRTKTLRTRANKRILIYYGLWTKFLVIEFLCIQISLNIMKFTHICNMLKNMKTTECGTNSFHSLSTGKRKIIRTYE